MFQEMPFAEQKSLRFRAQTACATRFANAESTAVADDIGTAVGDTRQFRRAES